MIWLKSFWLVNLSIRSRSTVSCVRSYKQARTAKLWLATLQSTRCALACPCSSLSFASSPYGSTTAQGGGHPYIMGKVAFLSTLFRMIIIMIFLFQLCFFSCVTFKIIFILNARFWLVKFIALVGCCAGGFFLPEEETFLEGEEGTQQFLTCCNKNHLINILSGAATKMQKSEK